MIYINKEELFVCRCLSKGIRGQQIKMDDNINIEVFEEIIFKHDISPIIYKALGKEATSRLKTNCMGLNLYTKKQRELYLLIIDKIYKNNIDIIVFKGIIMQQYYPINLMRTMGDLDFIIKEKDYANIKEILEQFNFIIIKQDPQHITFKNSQNISIEVHFKLIDNKKMNNKFKVFENFWEKTRIINIEGIQIRTLNTEETLAYLLLHLLNHKYGAGFGLRQLCDLVVFLEKEKISINTLKKIADKIHVVNFTEVILQICNDLLDYRYNYDNTKIVQKYKYLMIKDIISGGVHGLNDKKNVIRTTNTKIMISPMELIRELNLSNKFCILYPFLLIYRNIKRAINSNISIRDWIKYKVFNGKDKDRDKMLLWIFDK